MASDDSKKMVKECLADDSDRLSAWEVEFLDSVNSRGGNFTERQAATIEKIWQKLFGGPSR